ncbi:MAG: glycosyl transferase family 4 [Xanthomonadales bacterium]|nr:Decaprenyl-phosphate N-acetylglucosaminephosphotransferase [Xanthomonadales bacterium]MCC6592848.1 glycosyl transferase family 4 [Xanthomonadales bacterium]MCE7930534.1 glycosyl transferase family 4 [Xanthomonadales bacterium PRO6]
MSAILFGIVAAIVSWLLTQLAIAYARGARMQDAPAARRMHAQPTVRGAGIGFVAVIVAAWAGLGWSMGWEHPLGRWAQCASLALLLVAVVSWIDDRHVLPALPRLAAHFLAGGLLLIGVAPTLFELPLSALAAAAALLAIASTINFWNFVDGIDGLAASQALVLSAILAVFAVLAGDTPAAWFAAITAGAVLGFLPSNFPRARAFMGDVGSASLGCMVAALALQPREAQWPALWPALLLAAPVLLDAGLTLAWRMLRRRRRWWYTAHREHLYQWLARSGWGHTRTTLVWLACTAGIAVVVLLIGPERPQTMLTAVIVVYLVGALGWRLARDRTLAGARRRA